MGLENEEDGTLLTEEESDGILIAGILKRSQLDEHEQNNIETAIQWLIIRSFQPAGIWNESFIKNLHKRMYDQVWSWAGKFRKSNKNLGVDWTVISIELKKLLDDAL